MGTKGRTILGVMVILLILFFLIRNMGNLTDNVNSLKAENSEVQTEKQELRQSVDELYKAWTKERDMTKCGDVTCEGGKCYGVQLGDTLSAIALRFYGNANVSSELAIINRLKSADMLLAETCICLPPEVEGRQLIDGGRRITNVFPRDSAKQPEPVSEPETASVTEEINAPVPVTTPQPNTDVVTEERPASQEVVQAPVPAVSTPEIAIEITPEPEVAEEVQEKEQTQTQLEKPSLPRLLPGSLWN